MNKRITTLLMLPLLAGLLTGCGGGGGDATTTSEGGNTSSSEVSGKITINFWHTFGQTVVDGLTSKVNKFVDLVKQNEGVDVEIKLIYQGGYDDIYKKISDGFAVDNTPTIAVAYADHVADYLDAGKAANVDYIANLDEFINDNEIGFGKESYLGDKYDEDDFIEDFYREGSSFIQDGTYLLPLMKSTEVMFYNMDQLKLAMQFFKPEFHSSETMIANYMKTISWDDFMELCDCINKHQEDISNMLEVPCYYDSDGNMFISKMYQNDIPYSSISNGRGHIDFEEGDARVQTEAMLGDFYDAHKDNLFTTKGVVNKYGSDWFTNEKCVFSIGSSGGAGYNFPQAEAFDLGVCRVPDSNNNPLYVSQGVTLAMFNNSGLSEAANARTKKYAWKFMKYITNAQNNVELCINGSEGYVPVRESAYETEMFLDFMEEGENYAQCYRVILEDINSGGGYLVSPSFKGSATLRDQCGSLLTAVLNANSKDEISGLVQTAIDNTKLKM